MDYRIIKNILTSMYFPNSLFGLLGSLGRFKICKKITKQKQSNCSFYQSDQKRQKCIPMVALLLRNNS